MSEPGYLVEGKHEPTKADSAAPNEDDILSFFEFFTPGINGFHDLILRSAKSERTAPATPSRKNEDCIVDGFAIVQQHLSAVASAINNRGDLCVYKAYIGRGKVRGVCHD